MLLNNTNYFLVIIRFMIWVFGNFVKDIYFWSNFYLKFYTIKKWVIPVLLIMRDFSLISSKILVDLTAVDYVSPPTLRLHLHYLLLSIKYNMRYQVCTTVEEKGQMWTSTKLFLSSLWLERETWNMFGITFSRDDTARAILTDYGFRNYPLVKNFPMTGYWQKRYNQFIQCIKRYEVKLMQEYRRFSLSHVTDEKVVNFELNHVLVAVSVEEKILNTISDRIEKKIYQDSLPYDPKSIRRNI